MQFSHFFGNISTDFPFGMGMQDDLSTGFIYAQPSEKLDAFLEDFLVVAGDAFLHGYPLVMINIAIEHGHLYWIFHDFPIEGL